MEKAEEILEKLNSFVQSKTVTGEPIKINDDITLIPFTKMAFGMGKGIIEKKDIVGLGGSVEPVGFMVINNDEVSFIDIKSSGISSKLIDVAQHVIEKFANKKDQKEKK